MIVNTFFAFFQEFALPEPVLPEKNHFFEKICCQNKNDMIQLATIKPMIKESNRIGNLQRAAGGVIAAVIFTANGLMRATESAKAQVAVDG